MLNKSHLLKPCPKCGAKIGEFCTTDWRITIYDRVHNIRIGKPARTVKRVKPSLVSPCPICGAGAGQTCRTSVGEVLKTIHRRRSRVVQTGAISSPTVQPPTVSTTPVLGQNTLPV